MISISNYSKLILKPLDWWLPVHQISSPADLTFFPYISGVGAERKIHTHAHAHAQIGCSCISRAFCALNTPPKPWLSSSPHLLTDKGYKPHNAGLPGRHEPRPQPDSELWTPVASPGHQGSPFLTWKQTHT